MPKDVKVNIVAKDKGSKVVKKFSDNTTSALKKIAGPVALGAVVAGFAKLMNDTVKLGDKFHKLNLKLGVSVETLSKMEHIANLSGVSFTIVTGSIERMQRRIGLATRGLGAAKKAFEELNIDVEALSKLDPEEQFLRLAEATQKIENPVKRAAIQMEIFGMTAAELNKMLPGLRNNLSETAASVTTEQANNFAKYTDNMEKLRASLETLKVTVFAQLVQTLNDADWDAFAEGIRKISKEMADLSAKIYYYTKAFLIALDPSKTTYKRLKDLVELRKEYNKYLLGPPEKYIDEESAKRGPSYKGYIPSGGEDTTTDKNPYESEFEKNKDALRAMHAYELQMKDEHHIALAQKDSDAWMNNLNDQNEYNQKRIELIQSVTDKEKKIEDKAAADAANIAKKKFQTQQQFLGQMGNLFGDFGSMLDRIGSDSEENEKKTFKLKKAMSIAEATVKTYKAANDALAEYSGPAGIAMAAIITATGLANVATIAKTEPKYAKGGVFTNSIVSKPTSFQQGLMGEAGPEAILPLSKTSSGELGVKAQGSGQQPTQINYNIMAMDSKSFVDFVRQNPSAVTTVMNEQMQRGNSALNANIRRVSR